MWIYKGTITVVAILTLKQIMEKAFEYNIELEFLLMDLQRAFDKIKIKAGLTEMTIQGFQ